MFYKKKRKNHILKKIAEYFDSDYYLKINNDVKDDGADPLVHYTVVGYKEDRMPNRWFAPNFYREANPDLKEESNLFLHYLLHGWKEKRLPNPFVDHSLYEKANTLEEINAYLTKEKVASLKEESGQSQKEKEFNERIKAENLIISLYFDPEYYLEINKDIKEKGIDPLHHYLTIGSKAENRIPNRWFSPGFYLESNPGLKKIDISPFLHYLLHGWKEKRLPNPFVDHSLYEKANTLEEINAYLTKEKVASLKEESGQSQKEKEFNERIKAENLIISLYFDPEYYLEINKDIKEKGIDPLHHYLTIGSKAENRIPNRWFSPGFYLESNPGLKKIDISPFLHYLLHGWKEKRLPNPFVDHSLYEKANTLEEINAYLTKEKMDALKDRKENEMGYVSSIYKFSGETYVKGWAITGCNEKSMVEIYLNGILCATVKADMYQEALKENGVGDGNYGFTVELPKDLLNTGENTIEVKSKFTKSNLINSPQVYQEEE